MFSQPLINVETIFSSQAIEKYAAGWIWPLRYSLSTSGLDKTLGDTIFSSCHSSGQAPKFLGIYRACSTQVVLACHHTGQE